MSSNSDSQDRFVDAIGTVVIQAAFARFELLRLEKLVPNAEPQNMVVSERLVMGIDTLLKLYQALDSAVKQLEEKGLVKRQASAEAPKAGQPKAKP
jgi:hypothetical protein